LRQSFLECRIPPPVVLLITVLLIWFIAGFDTALAISKEWRWGSAIFFTIIGLILDISSVLLFFKSKATVNPLKPTTSQQLVIQGFFNYSRNPMYLGMVFILLGAVCFFASPMSLVALLGFIYYITKYQIIPEERAMHANFGIDYDNYQQRVRRWL